ncbi:class III lanthionine synthetase LanKC [Natronosporangium hydrolyticum]|uniref:Class III lanthionine synthetase LanKC n=1 Tax=Natronosporangium hydrolyticum TaxID=2811111 RepID=A0A895YC80_9ACTN|nr:class III lanthionine synthetase LanKC [Natronosporangium hydrolyticum]QSB15434.1 class III lanthionine synthetase LanKC [Natronosporangium hydrolyticum]
MDLTTVSYTLADPDYYEPRHRHQDNSRPLRPSSPPVGWRSSRHDVWLSWEPPSGPPLPAQGWKIHVSATLPGASRVLDSVTAACATATVSFKHLASEFAFLLMGHKHGVRSQAGKFCTLYPATESAARQLLTELAGALVDEPGPYILSDRRFGDSRTVHYRYGAFQARTRVTLDGRAVPLLTNGSGQWVEDLRSHQFMLPEGVTDPFLAKAPAPAQTDGGVMIGGYRATAALAQSNAGGAYRAVAASGRPVFLKEARAHTGFHWDGSTASQRLHREHRVLGDLHTRAPGLAPEPIELFREWEHDFLVTELVPGSSLFGYAARRNPYLQEGSPAEFESYFHACLDYLAQLNRALQRLHELGYRFGDVNPRNVLITDDGQVRLIDFESCNRLDQPPIDLGAPGYLPPDPHARAGTGADDYGLSAVALTMLAPVHQQLVRNPAAVAHLAAHLNRRHPVPPSLWQLATRHLPTPGGNAGGAPVTPAPVELAADPIRHLRRLRDAIGRELVATAAPDDPDRIWPTVPEGYTTNTWNLAHGAAGVLHALHHAGLPADPRSVARFRSEALARRAEFPPGLHYGLAGIAAVLGEYGQLDEALTLVEAARTHHLTRTAGSWSGGSAGVGTALLTLHARTGEAALLAQAVELGDQLVMAEAAELLGPDNPTGLLNGRSGMALFLHQLWRATDAKHYLEVGRQLLVDELGRGVEIRGHLMFPDDDATPRMMPYLGIGSAGVALVLTRYRHADDTDERLATASAAVLAGAHQPVTVESGLYLGLAGLVFAHAEHADLAGASDPSAGATAQRLAAGLVAYAAPGPAGRSRVLGSGRLRFSCDLGTGAAGVLLALHRILAGPTGQLFISTTTREVN